MNTNGDPLFVQLCPADFEQSGHAFKVSITSAASCSALIADMKDALEVEAAESDDKCVLLNVTAGSAAGLRVAAAWIDAWGTAAFPCTPDGRWSATSFGRGVSATIGAEEFLESHVLGAQLSLQQGGIQRLFDAMIVADFLRVEGLLRFLAAFIAYRLSLSTPSDVKGWFNRTATPITHEERDAIMAMHTALLARRL